MTNSEEVLEPRYETKRFLPSAEAINEMREIRSQLREAQDRNPAVEGIGFFGSTTMGTENEDSDIDIVFFYNSEFAIKNSLRVDVKTLLNNFSFSREPHIYERNINENVLKEVYVLDISQKNLDRLIETASNNLENSTWYNPLCHLFHLSVGDGVYSARKYVLERLTEYPKGELIYSRMIEAISAWEREKGTKHSYPQYKNYPKSIQDAKNYFCLQDVDYVSDPAARFDTVNQLVRMWHKLRGYS